MLSTIARKPKSVQELIHVSDESKVIQMIEKGDENQKQWFQGLLRKQIFSDQKSIACVNKYYHLCTESDVERILSFCRGKEVDEYKLNVVLKCVSTIPLHRLVILITRYFRTYGNQIALNGKYNKDKLVLILNKMERNESDLKEILLLLLQNLREVLSDFYRECIKNSVYSSHFKEVFVVFKEIFVIDNVALICLEALLTQEIILENCEQLTALLKTLSETECIPYEMVIYNLIVSSLKKFIEKNSVCLLNFMTILNVC